MRVRVAEEVGPLLREAMEESFRKEHEYFPWVFGQGLVEEQRDLIRLAARGQTREGPLTPVQQLLCRCGLLEQQGQTCRLADPILAARRQAYIEWYTHLLEGFGDFVAAPPFVFVSAGTRIALGTVTVELHHFGRAHSDADLVVVVPGEDLILTGDVALGRAFAPAAHAEHGGSLVGLAQDRAGRGLVDPAALHADQPVLDNVGPADAVLPADLVEAGEDLDPGELLSVQTDRGALFESKSGKILWVVAGSDSDVKGKSSVHLIVSGDKGMSWQYSAPVASDDKASFNEASVYETPGGDIVAFLRTANMDDQACIARSKDGGRTFEPYQKMGFQGHPLNALQLPDKRVLLTYGYRHPPYGIRARILNPECTDFESAPEIILRDDGGNGDLGYSWPVMMDKRHILVTYYFNRNDGTRHIAGTILELY